MLIILDLKFGPIRVRMLQKSPFSWSPGTGQARPRPGVVWAPRAEAEDRRRVEDGSQGGHTCPRRGLPWARA